jgi:hypothetical protein
MDLEVTTIVESFLATGHLQNNLFIADDGKGII